MLEAKKLKPRNHGVPESRSFLVRFRRTYVLKTIFFSSHCSFEARLEREERKVSISLPKIQIDYLGFLALINFNSEYIELPFLLVNHGHHRMKVYLLNKL